MSNQPAPITISYWEGNETKDSPFTALYYIEWTQGAKSYYAHADESAFDGTEDEDEYQDGAGSIQHRGIPLPVRRALAELIFPKGDYSRDDAEYNVTCPHCGSTLGVN